MSLFESECFEEFINPRLDVIDAGPLHFPITNLSIKRDEDLRLTITTNANGNAKSKAKKYSAGTVRSNNDSLILDSYGMQIILDGIQPYRHNITSNAKNELGNLTEISYAQSIYANIQDVDKSKYLIEWLENVDDSYFIWPDFIDKKIETRTEIIFGQSDDKLVLEEFSESTSFARNCVRLIVDGFELYLSVSMKKMGIKKANSGSIIYLGCPSEEIRRKIRDCLSFLIGRPLIYLGYSVFDEKWKLVAFKSISPYTIGGAAFKLSTMPPAPLGQKFQNEIDSETFSTLVNSLYSKYEECNFGHVSWAYWHAVSAHVNIAAVHFGAAIEALMRSYTDYNGKKFQTSLINKAEWKILRNSLLSSIKQTQINDDEKNIFINKIYSLNDLPQSKATEKFLISLGIEFSQLELTAWQQRNNAAHGKEIENNDFIRLIKEVTVLKVLFNRVLLRIINSSFYYDYYSIDFPIRNITDSIPNE